MTTTTPIGTSIRMLTTAIFGEALRPGVVRALREAARHDFKLGNMLNKAVYLETLERQITVNKAKVRQAFENVYATGDINAYQAAERLAEQTDLLIERFENVLEEFKLILDGHNMVRDRLLANKKAKKAPLADGIYVLYVDLKSGERVQVAFVAAD